jgi:hypothetical protein
MLRELERSFSNSLSFKKIFFFFLTVLWYCFDLSYFFNLSYILVSFLSLSNFYIIFIYFIIRFFKSLTFVFSSSLHWSPLPPSYPPLPPPLFFNLASYFFFPFSATPLFHLFLLLLP